jgi:rRNA-processing protein FCF1
MERSYKVLIDTNFFFLPFYENFDIFEELPKFLERKGFLIEKFYTLRKNIWEVENKLKTAKSEKWRNIYKLVIQYIKKSNVEVIETPVNKNTDHLIVETVIKEPNSWVVCTQDRNLREVLRRLKIHVVYYAGKELHLI